MTSLTSSPTSMHVTAHAVGDYNGWLSTFKDICNEKGGFHTDVVKAKYHIAGKLSEQRDGKDVCIVICAYPKSNDEVMKGVLKFDGPPFVGGPDMIKNGAVIPPFEPNFQASLVYDSVLEETNGPLVMTVVRHGVGNFDEWLKAFKEAEDNGIHKSLSVVRSLVGQGPDHNGKATCVVVHMIKKGEESKMQDFLKMDAPPFVGGPDLIKNGAVIVPCVTSVMASVEYQHTY